MRFAIPARSAAPTEASAAPYCAHNRALYTHELLENPPVRSKVTNAVWSEYRTLLDEIDDEAGYIAVMAYLDRRRDGELAAVRESLARRTGRPTTFGWGPRFLHSTGQYPKGGPPTGTYLQITDEPVEDLPVPGRDFTFGQFIHAQAAGDAAVLAEHGRPVLRLHLRDRAEGLATVMKLLR